MIKFNYETDFILELEEQIIDWIQSVILSEDKKEGDINYVFCNDEYLHKINLEFLNHDTYTDIISFDYSVGNELHGDIFISVERVLYNAKKYEVDFTSELARVIVHGILHYVGYNDKSKSEKELMRSKEDYYIKQFVENI